MGIVWEEPPPQPRSDRGAVREFVDALKANPGKWAKYPRDFSNPSTAYQNQRRYPGSDWSSRSNSDGTYTYYARWIGEA